MPKKDVAFYMRQALELARKAKGATFPNPLVGCVIVKNGKIVGSGYHKKAGAPHAEIIALRQAGKNAFGATLYCTLEPCAHFGRTGPCVSEIERRGIKEVFVGMMDPNPITNGKGVESLRRYGIHVRTGYLQKEIAGINRPFVKAMEKRLPFVTIKVAESIDGKVATRTGESKWITSKASRQHSHRLRRFFDCIMVGINTVLKDDPGLEPSLGRGSNRLTKVIVDSDLKIPLAARLLNTKQDVIVAAIKKNPVKEAILRKKGAEVMYIRPKKGRVDLTKLLQELNNREIRSILVEGGAELSGSFMDARLADRLMVFLAPKIIGGRDALAAIAGDGVDKLSYAAQIRNLTIKKIGDDILVEGDIAYS